MTRTMKSLAAAALLMLFVGSVHSAQLVREFRGTDNGVTPAFTVEAPWILDWRLDGDYDQLVALDVSLVEASMDLGANGFQTFRHVLLPQLGTALLAGGMLAFALSFDEVIVTTFTAGQQSTLPIWIFSQLTRPRDRPVTNVVALFVILMTALPILLANRLTESGEQELGK